MRFILSTTFILGYFLSLNQIATITKVNTWQVKAFVLATLCSLPAFTKTPQLVIFAIEDSTLLTILKQKIPRDWAIQIACFKSSVSPD